MLKRLYRTLFWTSAYLGRPFGGIRPRRLVHWLAQRGYDAGDVEPSKFRWLRDRWGSKLLLHPYYHLDRHIVATGDYDDRLHRMIEQHVQPGMVCFDVGANLGEVTLHMARRVGPTGRVYAFEPAPAALQRLTRHVEANGLGEIVQVYAIALSSQTGHMTMALAEETESNQGMGSLVNRDCAALKQTHEVRTMTLDDFVSEHGIERIDLMKVDIQGAEPLLLEGGQRTFSEMAPDLFMEISPDDLAGLGLNSRDLLRAVEKYGYGVYAIEGTRIDHRLDSEMVPERYATDNIFCSKRTPATAVQR